MKLIKKIGLIALLTTSPIIAQNPDRTKIDLPSKIENKIRQIEEIRDNLPIKYNDSKLKYEIKLTEHIYIETQYTPQEKFHTGNNKKQNSQYFGLTFKIKP